MDFSTIAILFATASLFGILARSFKQPILIGYLFAGFTLALGGVLKDSEVINFLGKVGVTFLLFLVGLEVNIKEIPKVGKVVFYTGMGQIFFTFILTLIAGLGLGFPLIVSSYIAIATTFSSTIIIVKLLSEKKALKSLYGKISVGFLLVQDLVAIIILVFLSSLSGNVGVVDYLFLIIKASLIFGAIWFLSKKRLPNFFEKYIASSQELLFISSISWALGIAALVSYLGFTFEVGGFLAGISLSSLPEHLEIASKTRSLRDFFLTIFFLWLGSKMLIPGTYEVLFPAIVYSILVLVANPIVLMTVMGFLRFKKRTSFLASVTTAQISEFSLIIVSIGQSLGHLESKHVALTVYIASITMTVSTYLILGADRIYMKIKDKLGIFERKNPYEIAISDEKSLENHTIVVGCLRTGPRVTKFLKRYKYPYVIVDFDPEVYKRLVSQNEPVVFGDIADPEILDFLSLEKARLVVSTIDSLEDNLVLLEYIRRLSHKPKTIFTSSTVSTALKLYENKASFVVVTDILAGDYIRQLVNKYGSGDRLSKIGKKHFKRLSFKQV